MATLAPHTHVLVAIDYSEMSSHVVDEAWAFALKSRSCSMHFLHVNRGSANDEWDPEGGHIELLEWLEARLPKGADTNGSIRVIAHEARGEPWQAIVQMAADLHVDTVIVGTHGRKGMQRILLGSVAETVSRLCGCSVLVVRSKAHEDAVPRDPICGLCVEARIQSQGNVLWCHDHAARPDRRHAYLERRPGRRILGGSRV